MASGGGRRVVPRGYAVLLAVIAAGVWFGAHANHASGWWFACAYALALIALVA